MNILLTALRQYQAMYGVLPCPADPQLAMGSGSYGVAAANIGTGTAANCVGGGIYADTSQHIAIGMVPVTSLGLSYDYAFDAWGRDITYAVDTAATGSATGTQCWLSTMIHGVVTINDNGNTINTPLVLISHGVDGYGAWLPLQGASGTASRLNTGSQDAAQQANAQVNGSFANNTSFVTFIAKPTNQTFDDKLAYRVPQWNFNSMPASYVSTYNVKCAPVCTPVSGYGYCRQITIDHTKVPNTDQTNFPLLFAGTYNYLATTGNGGSVTNGNGYDMVFTSDSAGTSALKFEQESYNSVTGAVNYWVKVPIVSHTADTNIYISYGNSSVTTDQSSKTAVWTVGNNYQGVWHFGSGVNNAGPNFAAAPIDSSNTNSASNNGGQYSYTGTSASIASPLSGGTGANFSNGYMQFGVNATYDYFENSPTFTAEFWVNKTVSSATKTNDWGVDACDLVDTSGVCSWGVLLTSNASTGQHHGTNDCPSFLVNSSAGVNYAINATGANCLTVGNWAHIVAVRNGSTNTLYVNGVQAAQGTGAPTSLSNTAGQAEFWAGRDSGPASDADKAVYIDEMRFSPAAYSAAWISTEYNNQAWPDKSGAGVSGSSAGSGFYTVSAASSR